ncbi:MAG: inositol monophosphatase family protein [Raineya sp.]
MSDFIKLCPLVNEIARKVGFFISQQRFVFEKKHIEHKGLNDLVSYVDKEAEKQLVDGLHKIFPEAAFITEENPESHQFSKEEFHWVIDPLDGTTNFIHGLPIFAISIALMQKNEVVLACVYEINHKECFYASKGEGAFCNGVKIKTSETELLQDALLATGFPYHFFEKNQQYLQILNRLMQKSQGLRRMGSAAVDLAYTACGRFEGFFEFNLKPWDVAAGALLVQEAGGQVGTFGESTDFIFGKEIIAAGNIFEELKAQIKEFW